jgi:hypothetical protein
MTEFRYFELVRKNKHSLGIKSDVDIINLSRYDQDVGNSDIRWMSDALVKYRYLIMTGEYDVHLFVGDIVQQIYSLVLDINNPKCIGSLNTCIAGMNRKQQVGNVRAVLRTVTG